MRKGGGGSGSPAWKRDARSVEGKGGHPVQEDRSGGPEGEKEIDFARSRGGVLEERREKGKGTNAFSEKAHFLKSLRGHLSNKKGWAHLRKGEDHFSKDMRRESLKKKGEGKARHDAQ